MRRLLIPAVALLAVGATGFGIGWSLNESGGGAGERLTGSEAAELARRSLIENPTLALKITCEAKDFNRRTEAWIVVCATTPELGGNLTFRVFDDDGRVERVE